MRTKKIQNGNLSYRHGKRHRKRHGYAFLIHPAVFFILIIVRCAIDASQRRTVQLK